MDTGPTQACVNCHHHHYHGPKASPKRHKRRHHSPLSRRRPSRSSSSTTTTTRSFSSSSSTSSMDTGPMQVRANGHHHHLHGPRASPKRHKRRHHGPLSRQRHCRRAPPPPNSRPASPDPRPHYYRHHAHERMPRHDRHICHQDQRRLKSYKKLFKRVCKLHHKVHQFPQIYGYSCCRHVCSCSCVPLEFSSSSSEDGNILEQDRDQEIRPVEIRGQPNSPARLKSVMVQEDDAVGTVPARETNAGDEAGPSHVVQHQPQHH